MAKLAAAFNATSIDDLVAKLDTHPNKTDVERVSASSAARPGEARTQAPPAPARFGRAPG